MADSEHLLGKAHALTACHRLPGAAADPDAGIPVLDEVVQVPPDGEDLPVLTKIVPALPADAEQIAALATSMHASLLARLKPEIDALIEERLKQGLSPLVEALFDAMRNDLQRIARDILSDAIRVAVEREIHRRK